MNFSFKLYLRLSVVAGITWIMEVISFISIHLIPSVSGNFIFKIFDVLNALQGVFIFIVFLVRRRVLCLIRERFGLFNHNLNEIFYYLTI